MTMVMAMVTTEAAATDVLTASSATAVMATTTVSHCIGSRVRWRIGGEVLGLVLLLADGCRC